MSICTRMCILTWIAILLYEILKFFFVFERKVKYIKRYLEVKCEG